jgi:type II secretory pathway component PulJ
MKARRQNVAFTLLETLVSIAILSAMTAALAAGFAGGLRVWQAVAQLTHGEIAMQTAWVIVARDVMNARPCRDFPFDGDSQAMSFASARVAGSPENHDEEPVEVRYRFDPDQGVLSRRAQRALGDAEQRPADGAERLLANLAALSFEYWAEPDEEDAVPTWRAEWKDPQTLPRAVRMRFRWRGEEHLPERIRTVLRAVRSEKAQGGRTARDARGGAQ